MHKRLKEFVASHSKAIALSPKLPRGQMEVPLPSGDVLDVLFKRGIDLVGVEVKSLGSGIDDIARGVLHSGFVQSASPVAARAAAIAEMRIRNSVNAVCANMIAIHEGRSNHPCVVVRRDRSRRAAAR
jgi:hypothetical protein